jgi:AbiU2
MVTGHALADVAPHFCRLAGDVISQWEFQKRLSEHWASGGALRSARFGAFFTRINDVLVEGWFLSVARLHDPASSSSQENLSVKYIAEHPQLDPLIRSELQSLISEMQRFADTVKAPRNKLLAHKDVHTVLGIGSMGCFAEGQDGEYIDRLRTFATLVSERVCSTPFVYDDLVRNDVDSVMSALSKGLAVIEGCS